MRFIAKTFPELIPYAQKELKSLGCRVKKIKDTLEIETDDFFKIVQNSHFIEILEHNGEDAVGFSLFSRQFLHTNREIPSYVVDILVNDMKITKEDSIIDPCAGFGEVILETGVFIYGIPLHMRKNFFYAQKEDLKSPMPKLTPTKHKLTAVVQDNMEFKKIQENAKFFRLKPKCSKFEFDWLDVKYHEGDFDYVITAFPEFEVKEEKEDFEKEFFYQAEFISKKKIGVITTQKISKTSYGEYVSLVSIKEISGFYCYIFK